MYILIKEERKLTDCFHRYDHLGRNIGKSMFLTQLNM